MRQHEQVCFFMYSKQWELRVVAVTLAVYIKLKKTRHLYFQVGKKKPIEKRCFDYFFLDVQWCNSEEQHCSNRYRLICILRIWLKSLCA